VIAVVVACSGGTGAQPSAAPGCGVTATFILANPGGLTCLDDTARTLGKLVQLPDQSAPSTPALHPSGTAIAFALVQQPDPKRGFGSDIYVVNLDGTGLKPIVQHEDNNVFYASPRFDSSGNVLYVHRRSAIIQNGAFVGNEDGIERVDLRTGQRTKIIKDGADPTISQDGKSIVYVHLRDSQIDALWRADIDGSNAGPLLKGKDSFWYLQAPRFSPTACTLVFSAAGHTVTSQAGVPYALRQAPSAPARLMHLSIPSDLYQVPCDGTSLKSVGQTGDDVVPAWSPDGKRVAYVGSGGMFVLDVATQVTRTIAQGQDFFFGDLVWVR
jgi:Tol biopolymer transport system component